MKKKKKEKKKTRSEFVLETLAKKFYPTLLSMDCKELEECAREYGRQVKEIG